MVTKGAIVSLNQLLLRIEIMPLVQAIATVQSNLNAGLKSCVIECHIFLLFELLFRQRILTIQFLFEAVLFLLNPIL